MKNSLSLLSVCLLFLALGLSSCKKEYTCLCTYGYNSSFDDYTFTIKETKSNAESICFEERNNPEAYYPTGCHLK